MPGEHDAALDRGEEYQQFFGDMQYVSDPTAAVGEAQLEWLRANIKQVASDARIVALTHRLLFDLAPAWDWATRDGDAVSRRAPSAPLGQSNRILNSGLLSVAVSAD